MCNKMTDIVTIITIDIATDIGMSMMKSYKKNYSKYLQTLSYQGEMLYFQVIFKEMI